MLQLVPHFSRVPETVWECFGYGQLGDRSTLKVIPALLSIHSLNSHRSVVHSQLWGLLQLNSTVVVWLSHTKDIQVFPNHINISALFKMMLCSHPALLIYSLLQAWLYKALLSPIPEECQSLLQPHTCLTTSLVAGQLLTHHSALPESSSPASPTWISPKHPISAGNLAELISAHPAASVSCCPGSFGISWLFPPPVTPSLTAHEPFQAGPEEMHLLYSHIM